MPEGSERLARELAESLGSALEKMFFVCDLAPCEPEAAFRGAPIAARVDFTGAPSGWLELRAGSESARALAANFLAEDEGFLDRRQVEAVFGELANMVCGGVLTRTEPRCIFRLSAPRVGAAHPRSNTDDWGAQGAGYAVMLESGPLSAELSIEAAP